ncbi:MAG TPA: DUF4142 domain-containing protein [Bryobacteraceae bacterium]|nr:DUF4142 domain-containing protein [Bryobacteraceae bacterium]
MNVSVILKRFALAAVVAALASPVASLARDNHTAANMPTGSNFLTAADQINLGEIELGKLAEQKGNNPAIRDFGKRMVADHSKLEAQLQSLAKSKGVNLPAQPASAVATLQQQLSKDSGSQFDQVYLQHMLAGHKQAIDTFENEIEHGQNTAYKSYAESALPVIQDHIRIAEDVAGKMNLSGSAGLASPAKAIKASALPS